MEIYWINEKTTERIKLSEGRSIKFKMNPDAEKPLFSVQYFFKDSSNFKSLGSVKEEQIEVIANGLLMISKGYADELNFIARAKYMISGKRIIEPNNDNDFETLLNVFN